MLRDDYHSLATICGDKIFAELYYSRNEESLAQLERLVSDNPSGNFDMPDGVGRLIEERSLLQSRRLPDENLYIREGRNYSPNRLEFKATLPTVLVDFTRDVNFNRSKLNNGDVVYYKWAKRIEKENENDPTKFSETFAVTYRRPFSLSAGEDKTITLPDEQSVVLEGSIIDDFRITDVQSVEWEWVRGNFVPTPSEIINPGNPITVVNFSDYGRYNLQLSARDNCGRVFRDTVEVSVLGQLNSGEGRRCSILSEGSCENTGRNMFIKNSADHSLNVTIRHTHDLRSWQDERTPGHGTIVENEFEIQLEARGTSSLGCSVVRGTALNGHDVAYSTWAIMKEEEVE